MGGGDAGVHDLRRRPFPPAIIGGDQSHGIFGRRLGDKGLVGFGEDALEPGSDADQPDQPDQGNLEQPRGAVEVEGEPDRSRAFVDVEGKSGRPLVPGVERQGEKFVVVVMRDQREMWRLIHVV